MTHQRRYGSGPWGSSNGLTGLGYAGALARRFAVNQKMVMMEEASIARRPACRPERTGIGDARDSGGRGQLSLSAAKWRCRTTLPL